jgi:GWxTD domain-containing protein
MKPLFKVIPLLFLFTICALRSAAAVDVVVETRVFHQPGDGPRVEVNMAFIAGTMINQVNERGFHQPRVQAVTIIEQNGVVKAFSKVEVQGIERLDSLEHDLLHQEFFNLAPGDYDLSIEARDLNSSDTTATRYFAPLAVGSLSKGVVISEVQFAERIEPAGENGMAKYGYQVIPLISDYFPKEIGQLNIYAEIYGTDEHFGTDSLFLLTYQIETYEDRKVHGSFKRNSRVKGKPVEPVIAQFDIGKLASGNYLLVLEVRDRQGELVSRREQFFQRNNPRNSAYDPNSLDQLDLTNTFADNFRNKDTLAEFVNSLRPIADPLERKIIDDRWRDRDMDHMKRFFYVFWANRSPSPELAWKEYREQVIMVNKLFSCRVLRGYETDRGYVYLKYGAPNTMMDRFNEMGTVPYTIWHYYRAGRYTNKRFIFYQPDIANNCFQLLHSEVPGEMQNPQWNHILHQRNNPIPGVRGGDPGTLESDRVREFFNDPR